MEEDTNMEASAPASPGVHADALGLPPVAHGAASELLRVERGNRSICSLQHQCSHAHINNMRGSISSPRMVTRPCSASGAEASPSLAAGSVLCAVDMATRLSRSLEQQPPWPPLRSPAA
ncbi:hypothetical protein PF003_g9531 [Phytophthora fragariae]|nr:hypothetical protein PF003_g9531 [Phytophthora fragariae]